MTDNTGLIGGQAGQLTLLPGLLGGVGLNTNSLGLNILPGLAGGVNANTSNALLGVDVLPGLDLGGGIDIDILPDIGGGTGGGGSGTGDNGSGDVDGNGNNGVENPGGSGSGGSGWLPGSNTQLDLEVAYQNITRVDAGSAKAADDVAALTQIWNRVDAGTLTTTEAVRLITDFAIDTSAVAITSYQFFTGKTPTVAGLDFLVNAVDSLNPTDLTDAYYQGFNLENRYINFAANLGLFGEAAVSFKNEYGGLDFEGAVRKAYGTIIGNSEAAAAGVNVKAAIADIVGRKSYFDTLASSRIGAGDTELAAKAGLIGYVLAEAIKADVGIYANALENFYFDLADSEAQFNVSLVAAYSNDTAWMA